MAIELVKSSDPQFAEQAMIRNGRFPVPEESPAQIMVCHSAEDVALAVEQTVHGGKRPTILSGGHCYENFVFDNPAGNVIAVRSMNGISQDPASKRWKIESGATVGEMYFGMYTQGNVTIPAASCTSVGVGGHISGGGYGFLTRLYGIAPDWISAVDIVTVDAKGKVQLRHVDKKTDPDLLRACRGSGGGSFGVITAYYADAPPPAPKEVLTGNMSFTWGDMTPERLHHILYIYSSYWDTRGRDPDTWGLFTIMNMSPANPAVPNSTPRIGMSLQFCNPDGTIKDTKVLDEFLAMFDECKPVSQLTHDPTSHAADHLPTPSAPGDIVCLARHNVVQHKWIDATGSNNSGVSAPDGSHAVPAVTSGPRIRRKSKSAYMRKPYTMEEAQVFFKHLTDTSKFGGTGFAMDSFGGAASKPGLIEETSDAHRSSIIKMQFSTRWSDPAQDKERMTHIDRFYTNLFSASSDGKHPGTPAFNDRTQGCYIGYPDEAVLRYPYWAQLYWGDGNLYPYLQRVKKKYDPHNVFHHALSVRPIS